MNEEQVYAKRVMNKLTGNNLKNHVFAIRNKLTGQYSNGDSLFPIWGNKARTFKNIGYARSHSKGKTRGVYVFAEIVELELFPVKTHPLIKGGK